MKALITVLVSVLLVVAAASNGQTTPSQPLTKEVVQGCYLGNVPMGVWIPLTSIAIDSCAYQIAIASADKLGSAIKVASIEAKLEISQMFHNQIIYTIDERWGMLDEISVAEIKSKATASTDAKLMLMHPIAYMVIGSDENGVVVQVAVGFSKKNGKTLEEVVQKEIERAAKEVQMEKAHAILQEDDKL